jgi:type II secretory pathway component PulK
VRKPRDYGAELKALDDKAKRLKERKVRDLGELISACGADVLPPEELAGALLQIAETNDVATKEGWRKRGAAFFQRPPRKTENTTGSKGEGTLPL